MALCFAYNPSPPRLYVLNTTAWLVLLLCDNATHDSVAAGLHEQTEPLLTRAEAMAQADAALTDLLNKQLIELRDGTNAKSSPGHMEESTDAEAN